MTKWEHARLMREMEIRQRTMRMEQKLMASDRALRDQRYKRALLVIVGSERMTIEAAQAVAAEALGLHPNSKTRWATWREESAPSRP